MQRTKVPGYAFLREAYDVLLGFFARIWIAVFGSTRAVVLAYHSVSACEWTHAVSPEVFRAQLAWLDRYARVVGLDHVEHFVSGTEQIRRPSVAITFDDGYRDWVTTVLPALAEKKMHATFFVTTCFSSVTSVPHDGLEILRPDHVRTLTSSGHEIGSHGRTHRDLSACSSDEFVEEIRSSRAMLKELSGQPVTRMSYPKGRFTPAYFPQLRSEGVTMAFAGHGSVEKGTETLAVPRVPVTKTISLRRFAARIYRAAAWGRV